MVPPRADDMQAGQGGSGMTTPMPKTAFFAGMRGSESPWMHTDGFTKLHIAVAMSCARAFTPTGKPRCHYQIFITPVKTCLNHRWRSIGCMRRFVSYCMSRVRVLRAAGVTPVIVFDGGKLPMKANEEEGRSR